MKKARSKKNKAESRKKNWTEAEEAALKDLWHNHGYKTKYDARNERTMDIMQQIAQIELKSRGFERKTISVCKINELGWIRKNIL